MTDVIPVISPAAKKWLLALSLFVVIVITYLPATRCGYVWDDDALLTQNAPVLTGEFLDLWTPGTTLQFYPLVFSSYWIEHKLWGLDPFGYHIDSILLHAGSTVILWLMLCRLGIPGAFVAALLFGLHPVHVESVAWITARKNVLSGLFYLASILAYLGFALPRTGKDRDTTRLKMYLLAFTLFLLAMLSKTVTCTMPAVILLILWWKRGRIEKREIMPLLPLFVLGAALGMLTGYMEKNFVLAGGADWQLSFVERCLIAGRALWFYAWKLLWPVDLTFIYPQWQIDTTLWWQWLFPCAALALVMILLILRRRIGRGPLTAVLFFAGTLVPALGFIDVYPMRYSFVADHFQYLASIGLIVLVVSAAVSLFTRFASRPGTVWATSMTLALILAGCTAWRCLAYEDEVTIWRDTIRKNPGCWMANYNLGNIYAVRGDVAMAINHYQAAIRIKPDCVDAHNNLAAALVSRNRVSEAVAEYKAALAIKPDHAEAYYNLGVILASYGQVDEAVANCRRALRIKPDYAKAHYKLATLLSDLKQNDKALAHFRMALDLALQQKQTGLAESIRSRMRNNENDGPMTGALPGSDSERP